VADAIETEAQAHRLVRRAKLCRPWFLPYALRQLRREYGVQRCEVLELLNRPMPRLQRSDLDAVWALPGDDPCARVLGACIDHRWSD
jgi:hypothetical protein